jgi:hypothetical protein
MKDERDSTVQELRMVADRAAKGVKLQVFDRFDDFVRTLSFF